MTSTATTPTSADKTQAASYARHLPGNRPRFGKILVATDFSTQAQTALRIAASLARQFHGSLLLVHTVTPIVYGSGLEACTSSAMNANLDCGRARMQDEIANCKALRGLEYETMVENASLIEIIHDLIYEEKVSLVVCGSHGAHGFEKLVLGSTAESIVNHAECPVLIVGPKSIPRGLPCDSILFSTDLASGSFRCAEYAAALAEEMNAQLTLLHVAPLPLAGTSEAEVKSQLCGRLRELVPREMDNLCHWKTSIRFGEASRQVCAAAEEERYGLIVMGIREHGPLADHAFWGTLTKTIQKAPCPVLTVRKCLIR